MVDKIAEGVVASINYVLTVDGAEFERSESGQPLEYLHGAENIVPGLEKALIGKKVGDKVQVTLAPADAYGEYDDEAFERVVRADIPDADSLEVGMIIELEDDDGNLFEAVIKELTKDEVVLDFNPELAGKTVTFDVEVVAIRAANGDEIAQGYPEGLESIFEVHYHDDDYDDED